MLLVFLLILTLLRCLGGPCLIPSMLMWRVLWFIRLVGLRVQVFPLREGVLFRV